MDLKKLFSAVAVSGVVAAGFGFAYPTSSVPTPTIQANPIRQARQLIAEQKFAEAAEIIRGVVAEQSENPQLWMLLGNTLRSAGEFDGSLEAFRAAMGFPATEVTATYNIGVTYGQMGDLDAAFEWVGRAKDTGTFDSTFAGIDPNAAALRADPRFATLLPTEAEFENSFVEDVTIIHEWRGEASGDQYGWIARNIGDVDGDGINDVTASAPSHQVNGRRTGKIYVYSGATGVELWARNGPTGGNLGQGIEAAGDVNVDGVPDVIAGAPQPGNAWVYSGRDGTTLLTLRSDESGDALGGAVSDVGDLNGDGHADLLVGAPQSNAAGQGAGSAYVYSGADGSILLTLRGAGPGDAFGSAVGGASDLDAEVFVVGAGNAGGGPGQPGPGRAYVFRGLNAEPVFVIEPDGASVNLGQMFVSVVGDVDADGVLDVYAADWASNANGRGSGGVFIHSGATGERLLSIGGEAPGDGFGIGVADAGDVDGDGHADLIIGAWQHGSAAPSGGKTYLYSGRDGSLLLAYTSKVMGETFGFDATGMGDVDGDGTIDFLLTSAWSAANGARSGRMFIVSGKGEQR